MTDYHFTWREKKSMFSEAYECRMPTHTLKVELTDTFTWTWYVIDKNGTQENEETTAKSKDHAIGLCEGFYLAI